MGSLLMALVRYFRYLPAILWVSLVSLAQWFIPRRWMAKNVSGETVLITGAGAGLGRELALEFARLNASLVLWDINAEGLRETKELVDQEHAKNATASNNSSKQTDRQLTRFCLTYLVDVSDRTKVQTAAQQVQADLQRMPMPMSSTQTQTQTTQQESKRYVSILVNNAGIYYGQLLQELKDEQIERIFKINILAHFWTVRAFLPQMIEHQHGHIVEIASMGGLSGFCKQVDYCATKFATVGFEESLSIELMTLGLGDKIRTTAICPFFFSSNLFTGFDSKAAAIMSSRRVARDSVLGIRCNYSQVLLPSSSYFLNFLHPITPRKFVLFMGKILNLFEGTRDIKGTAAG